MLIFCWPCDESIIKFIRGYLVVYQWRDSSEKEWLLCYLFVGSGTDPVGPIVLNLLLLLLEEDRRRVLEMIVTLISGD